MMNCGYDCENCGKYTSAHYNGTEYTEYHCLETDKYVKVSYDEEGNEESREIY